VGGGGGRTRSWGGGGGGRRVRGWVALFRGRARRVAACRHALVAQGHRFKYQEITFFKKTFMYNYLYLYWDPAPPLCACVSDSVPFSL